MSGRARLTIEGDQALVTDIGYAVRSNYGPASFSRFDEEILAPAWIDGDVCAVRQGGRWRWVHWRRITGWGDDITDEHVASGLYKALRRGGQPVQ